MDQVVPSSRYRSWAVIGSAVALPLAYLRTAAHQAAALRAGKDRAKRRRAIQVQIIEGD